MDRKNIDFEIRFYERILKERPNYVDALMPLADAYTRKGLFKEGLEIDRRLSRLCRRDPVVFYNLACSYALVGQKKRAIQTLKKSVMLGYRDYAHLRKDPDLKVLAGDPEFDTFLANLKPKNK